MYPTFERFFPAIQNLPFDRPLTKNDLIIPSLLMEREDNLEMYYAPHNEYVNTEATIVLIGITPGWSQMKTAYEQLVRSIASQHGTNQMLKEVKRIASFSGSTRKNLVDMLDACGLHNIINKKSSLSLFEELRPIVHTTSVIKYPVFYQGKNYTGYVPKIEQSALLSDYAFRIFPKELRQLKRSALIIPLGKVVGSVLQKIENKDGLQKHTYLYGFPHPSGANGHRMKQLTREMPSLVAKLKEWSESIQGKKLG